MMSLGDKDGHIGYEYSVTIRLVIVNFILSRKLSIPMMVALNQ